MQHRKVYVNRKTAEELGWKITTDSRYRLDEHRLNLLNKHKENRGILEACDRAKVDPENVPYLWIKSSSESVKVNNPHYIPGGDLDNEIDFTEVYKDVKPIKYTPKTLVTEFAKFDRLVISDLHIGLLSNPDGNSLYGSEWSEEILMERLEKVINWTLDNQKSNTLYIIDCGDTIDGMNNATTRGGHHLPQNMSNQQMFDVAVKFKLTLLSSLAPYFNKIVSINVTDSNHGGNGFEAIISSAYSMLVEKMYPHFEVISQHKFIDHYIIDNRVFLVSHGKDQQHMKHGFKVQIDAKQILKIKDYIDFHNLHQYKCYFMKGDSHMCLFDYHSSKNFIYENFGAFSNPSAWVQTNFGYTKSSFTHFNHLEEQDLTNNYFFN